MYLCEYNKVIERMKTAMELLKDMNNYERCKRVLCNFDRTEAWKCLQDMIHEYYTQIEICGLSEGIRLYNNVPLAQVDNRELQTQIMYIGQRIPAYVLVRESQAELAKRICKWLENGGN